MSFADNHSNQTETVPELLPLEDFFRNPEMTGFDLSPDGTKIAWLAPWQGRMNIFVNDLVDAEGNLLSLDNFMENAERITTVTERDISSFGWITSERILYPMDQGGDENYHLWAVDIDGGNLRDLTPFETVKAYIIDDLRHDPEHMIVSLNNRDPQLHDAYRLNVTNGELSLLVENPGIYTGYLTDHEGKLRVAFAIDGVESSLFYRETEADEFTEVYRTDFRNTLSPQAFTFDNKQLYALSNIDRDKSALVVINPATAEEVEEIFSHEQVDLNGAIFSDKRQKMTGVSFTTSKSYYHWFDDHRKAIQEFLNSQFPELEVRIASSNLEEDIFLVRTFSDQTLGDYYYFNLQNTALDPQFLENQESAPENAPELVHLHEVAPWLEADKMAPMMPIECRSRDGLTLHGYLTLPVGVEHKNLPLVVNPHGGPWARDRWGFRPSVQFLANRGYAVLQINFRGSTGYGREFWEASFRQWGRAMQDDVSDAVLWTIEQGYADPEKVAIYGASYGGYATLAGLAYSPELYVCGIDYVGVSNLLTFMESLPPYWESGRQMLYTMVGNPEDPEQKQELTRWSPALNADLFEDPLLVVQGANDPRVVKPESDQMVAALRQRGLDVPYLVKDNEGHGFSNEENQFEFYRVMEQFLSKYLGGANTTTEDLISPLLQTPTE